MSHATPAIVGTRPFLFSAPMSLAAEIVAAGPGALVDSNTDEEDAVLLAERLEDPAFRDVEGVEDEPDEDPEGEEPA